jgi:EmrB/QacA subfamily drug resistance transporter
MWREPARPDVVREWRHAPWLVVATVSIGAFMGQLDASIVTLANPSLERSFHTSLASVEWVALSYLLVLVASVAAIGRFADMTGRKVIYVYGFGVFTLASAACGLAPNLPALDAFRAVQAIGAAMLQANSVALIATAIPREKLGRSIGIQGAAQALGLSMGPTLGGLLIGLGGWRLIFFVNVPAGISGIILGWLLLPRSRNLAPRQPFDWGGLVLLAPAVGCLLLALSLGSARSFASPGILALLVLVGVFGFSLFRRERRAAFPLLDPMLFRRVAFSAGIASSFLSYIVLFGVMFICPFFLEHALSQSPGRTGLVLTALPAALGITAPFAGRFADRVGPRLPTTLGMGVCASGMVAMAIARPNLGVLVVELAVVGVGLGAFTPPNNAAIMMNAPRDQAGVASGVLNMSRGTGTALGVALTGLVFGIVAGRHPGALATGHGFTAATALLGGIAVLAGVLAALRGKRTSIS